MGRKEQHIPDTCVCKLPQSKENLKKLEENKTEKPELSANTV